MRLDRILTLVKILRRKILKLNWDQELVILIKRSYFGESTQPLGPFCLWHCFCSGRFGDRRNWDGYHWDLSSLDWAMGWGWATYWVSNEQLYHYWSALQLNLELSQPSGLGHCHYWTQSWSQNFPVFFVFGGWQLLAEKDKCLQNTGTSTVQSLLASELPYTKDRFLYWAERDSITVLLVMR